MNRVPVGLVGGAVQKSVKCSLCHVASIGDDKGGERKKLIQSSLSILVIASVQNLNQLVHADNKKQSNLLVKEGLKCLCLLKIESPVDQSHAQVLMLLGVQQKQQYAILQAHPCHVFLIHGDLCNRIQQLVQLKRQTGVLSELSVGQGQRVE